MLVAADSESDLPIFPLLHPASKHDSHAFPETYFRMKAFLQDYHVSKWILDAAHDAMPYYVYCRENHIQPFIDLNEKRGIHVKYKDDFIIGKDGVPVCQAGRKMNHDGSEPSKARLERSNKREKIDFKLESGRHRSSKMWYCRLYHILMLQHLDAWDMPYESALQKLILQTA